MCSRFIDEFKLHFHDNGVPYHPMKEINGRDKDIKDNHLNSTLGNRMIVVVHEWKPMLSSQNIIEMR
jgi:hypothetical protein